MSRKQERESEGQLWQKRQQSLSYLSKNWLLFWSHVKECQSLLPDCICKPILAPYRTKHGKEWRSRKYSRRYWMEESFVTKGVSWNEVMQYLFQNFRNSTRRRPMNTPKESCIPKATDGDTTRKQTRKCWNTSHINNIKRAVKGKNVTLWSSDFLHSNNIIVKWDSNPKEKNSVVQKVIIDEKLSKFGSSLIDVVFGLRTNGIRTTAPKKQHRNDSKTTEIAKMPPNSSFA